MPPSWMPAAHDGSVTSGRWSSDDLAELEADEDVQHDAHDDDGQPEPQVEPEGPRPRRGPAAVGHDERDDGQGEQEQERVVRRADGHGHPDGPPPPRGRVDRAGEGGAHRTIIASGASLPRGPAGATGDQRHEGAHRRAGCPGRRRRRRVGGRRQRRRCRMPWRWGSPVACPPRWRDSRRRMPWRSPRAWRTPGAGDVAPARGRRWRRRRCRSTSSARGWPGRVFAGGLRRRSSWASGWLVVVGGSARWSWWGAGGRRGAAGPSRTGTRRRCRVPGRSSRRRSSCRPSCRRAWRGRRPSRRRPGGIRTHGVGRRVAVDPADDRAGVLLRVGRRRTRRP